MTGGKALHKNLYCQSQLEMQSTHPMLLTEYFTLEHITKTVVLMEYFIPWHVFILYKIVKGITIGMFVCKKNLLASVFIVGLSVNLYNFCCKLVLWSIYYMHELLSHRNLETPYITQQ
jgi:hypothetical protein